MKFLYAFLIIFFISSSQLYATSIVPFEDLGAVAEASDGIYVVTASFMEEVTVGDEIRFRQHFDVVSTFKGEIRSELTLSRLSYTLGEGAVFVAGDIDYESGVSYLLYLQNRGVDDMYPVCSNYYIYEITRLKSRQYAIPVWKPSDLNVVSLVLKKEEVHQVFDLKHLMSLTTEHLNNKKSTWNSKKATVSRDLAKKLWDDRLMKMNKPDYCNYLSSSAPYPRWKSMESDDLPIYYNPATADCNMVLQSELNAATQHLSRNYAGINITNPAASIPYVASCIGSGANGGNFTSFINTTYNDDRLIYISFDDPCNEIPDLVGCSGTLGFGGSYFGPTYTYNGVTYREQSYGFVVVNENVGSCYCDQTSVGNSVSNYALFMAHELTHALGINHIPFNQGEANMNPSCCLEISSIDQACVEFLYPSESAPCTHEIKTYRNTSIVNNATIRADQEIMSQGNVSISNNASVSWQAELELSINGPFEVFQNSKLTVNIEDCN